MPEEMLWECGWLQQDHRPSPTYQLSCLLLRAAQRQEWATSEGSAGYRMEASWSMASMAWPRTPMVRCPMTFLSVRASCFKTKTPPVTLSFSRAPVLMDWTWGRLRLFHRAAGQVLQSRAGGPCGLRDYRGQNLCTNIPSFRS